MQGATSDATAASVNQTVPDDVQALIAFFERLDSTEPLMRLGIAGTVIGVSLLLLFITRFVFGRRVKRMQDLPDNKFKPLRWQRQDLITAEDMRRLWVAVWRGVGWVLSLVFTVTAVTGALMTTELTMHPAAQLISLITDTLLFVWDGVTGYLPELVTIVVIVMIARFFVRTLGLIFDGIQTRRINVKNFYPEWAETSFSLIKLMVYALTAVIVFPYLPGSSSPAFQGISIFVGVLVSLGSTTAVANVVAGIVLTYTRAFKDGDQVEIAGVRGRVVERSTFVTRIQTLKNVIVSIPNSNVLSESTINYSQNMGQRGLLVHSSITIGYDVPWQQVRDLLIAAAEGTEKIVEQPEPFVLQTGLEDNYVSYEVNGWTRHPEELPRIYSDLHANILDQFHGHNVEITSPQYRAVRDGSAINVPRVLPNEESPGES